MFRILEKRIHYFSKNDLLEHFKEYQIIETGTLEDKENHGETGEHTHKLRYILTQKSIHSSRIVFKAQKSHT